MSCRDVQGKVPLEGANACNVVPLQPTGGNGVQGGVTTAALAGPPRKAPALNPDSVTRDGLDLLKAFFAIDDPAARATVVLMARRLAQHSTKR